jgi:hypothetical protein
MIALMEELGNHQGIISQYLMEQSDARASLARTCGRTTQCLGIILKSKKLGVTENLLELIGKTKKYQALGS